MSLSRVQAEAAYDDLNRRALLDFAVDRFAGALGYKKIKLERSVEDQTKIRKILEAEDFDDTSRRPGDLMFKLMQDENARNILYNIPVVRRIRYNSEDRKSANAIAHPILDNKVTQEYRRGIVFTINRDPDTNRRRDYRFLHEQLIGPFPEDAA